MAAKKMIRGAWASLRNPGLPNNYLGLRPSVLPTSNRYFSATSVSQMEHHEVIIIGAGLAGLAAARKLTARGKNVKILEGLDRIGGRVYTTQFADTRVEQGATFIIGACPANPVFRVAQELGIFKGEEDLRIFKWHVGKYLKPRGEVISQASVDKALEIFEELEKDLKGWYESGDSLKDEPVNLFDFYTKEVQDEIQRFPQDIQDDIMRVLECKLSFTSFGMGDSWYNISANMYGKKQELEGGWTRVPPGVNTIVQHLVNQLPPGTIMTGNTVHRVFWSNRGTKLETTGGDYTCDWLIITIPLGALKVNHSYMFLPDLPTWKSEAIDKIGWGKVNKLFMEWDDPWWAQGEAQIRLTYTLEEIQERTRQEWGKYIFGFEPVIENPRVLVAWVSEKGAEYVEIMDPDALKWQAAKLVKMFTGKSTPLPSKALPTQWCLNDYFEGGYSYCSVKTANDSAYMLSKPLPNKTNPRLMFAGEATDTRFYGTLHGAFMSGEREADRLLQVTKMISKKSAM
ncbi:unnamed protein product [Cyprideis torosa]|uniref:Amine oxidase n=1 Tax=Cyprideis torosa TaxID=163714 RepID=A0A7R8ZH71_9CRUS|nr:unnamed protein product [Cyprideis torosa]CAG0882958.1 unnamed protein product [Cyprideis torosa]